MVHTALHPTSSLSNSHQVQFWMLCNLHEYSNFHSTLATRNGNSQNLDPKAAPPLLRHHSYMNTTALTRPGNSCAHACRPSSKTRYFQNLREIPYLPYCTAPVDYEVFQPGFIKQKCFLRLVGFVVGHNKFMSYE